MKNRTGTIILIAIVVGVITLVVSAQKRSMYYPPVTTGTQNVQGLLPSSSELDNTDLDQIDSGVSQLDADASTF